MNYIGSKYSLLAFLEERITKVVGQENKNIVFCDLFAGTGVVGKYFKNKGYQIISNDLQYYSYVLLQQYIANNNVLLFKGLELVIPNLNDSLPKENRAERVCKFLDNIRPIIATKDMLRRLLKI